MRLRLYSIIIIMILTLAVPAIFLRGTLQQKTAVQVDGLGELASLEGVSLGPTIWSEGFNDVSQWTLSGANAPALLRVNQTLSLAVAFPYRSNPQSISVYRSVNLSLDQDPIINFNLKVSSGVSYGIRFFGVSSNNVSFGAWREGSSLQHRVGLGTQQSISANLVSESALANPNLRITGARITRVLFYLESAALTSGSFVLELQDLHANSIVKTPADSKQVNGNFTGLIADLGPSISSQGLFQVFVGLDITGTPDLSYTLYLTQGDSVLAQAYTYVPKVVTTHELALLSPALVNSAPLFNGGIKSSSLIISAWAGQITFFRLDSIEIRFLSTPTVQRSSLDPANYSFLSFYYFVLLFVIPVAMIVLMVRVFKDES